MTVEEDQTVQIPVQMKTHRRQLEVTRIHAVDRVEDHRMISAQYSLAALSKNMREGSNCANTSTDENAPLTSQMKLEVTRIYAVNKVEDHQTISAQYSLAALSENMREGSNRANTSTDENAPLTGQMKLEVTRIHAVDKVEDHRTISAQHSLAPLSKNLNMREGSNCANTSTLNSPHGLARLGQIFELSSK